jgi:hypothetical protein
MSERKYLHTFGDLIDRLSIVQMKAIFLPQFKAEYEAERDLILHDIDLLLTDKKLTAADVHAVMVLTLANRVIWENESAARNAGGDQSFTQFKTIRSINGVRVSAKNRIASDRPEYKVDMIANDIPPEFGNWGGIFK